MPSNDFLHPLGHKDDRYFYISSSNSQITVMSPEQHSKARFMNLMPLGYWYSTYAKYKDENNGNKMQWDRIANDLMEACRAKGIFDGSIVRGVGVWHDPTQGGVDVINLGRQLFIRGTKKPLNALTGSRYIYEIGHPMPDPLDYVGIAAHKELVEGFDGSTLTRVCKLVNWENPASYKLLAGWLVVSLVAGALKWRPHVWITGGAGTGKTWLMENLINPFIQERGIFLQGNTTEAGLRQMLDVSSIPAILDEFETQDEHSNKRIQFIMELFRQASSTGEGQVAKGSPSGNAVLYRISCSVLVSSIRVALQHESDRSRFAVLELARKSEGTDEKFDVLAQEIKKITPEYIEVLFARTFRCLPRLREIIAVFGAVLRKKSIARVGQQYGALLGGYWTLYSNYDPETGMRYCDRLPTEKEAGILCDEVLASLTVEDKEEKECFNYMIAKQIDAGMGEKGYKTQQSIADLILREWRDPNEAVEGALARWGMRVVDDNLYVVNKNHPELASIFKGTKWSFGWGNSLVRLPGAKKKTVGIHSLGSVYSVIIPLTGLMEKDIVPF